MSKILTRSSKKKYKENRNTLISQVFNINKRLNKCSELASIWEQRLEERLTEAMTMKAKYLALKDKANKKLMYGRSGFKTVKLWITYKHYRQMAIEQLTAIDSSVQSLEGERNRIHNVIADVHEACLQRYQLIANNLNHIKYKLADFGELMQKRKNKM